MLVSFVEMLSTRHISSEIIVFKVISMSHVSSWSEPLFRQGVNIKTNLNQIGVYIDGMMDI